MKKCNTCGTEYPASSEFFARCAKHPDGLSYKCRSCVAEYNRAYYRKREAELKNRAADYHRANPERVRASKRARYLLTREERLARERARYHADPDVRRRKIEAANRSAIANPERTREYKRLSDKRHPETKRRNRSIRRARERATRVDRICPTAVLAKTGGLCTYCATPLTLGSMHMDHMTPLARGGQHVFGNLTPACGPCNRRKFTKTAEEFCAAMRHGVAVSS